MMAGSLNKATIIGNCTRDPEVRHIQDGKPIVNLSVATNESWKDKATGERKEKVEYHRVVIFNEGLAKVAEQYVKKGTSLYIEGQLQTRKWTDKDGAEKYSTEIVLQQYRGELTLLGGRPDKSASNEYDQSPVMDNTRAGGYSPSLDDSVPFAPEFR